MDTTRKRGAGEDVSNAVDWSKARRRNVQPKRVNVDFPAWVVDRLDKEARHLGVTRQSLIKLWIAEKLQ
ncbi:type II toxin-antitoxin system BrnA family antitoxin [Aquibaculum arenosum]|uniref:CopG family transcriptional regulator n=1 Tax=Aquibaculum arenosum TaxID=3032591 RepID=A0ABT5YKJ7_9PROT|nr:CopG family transcriptional regulator [Fodinicurvata sp. CAU 1616]